MSENTDEHALAGRIALVTGSSRGIGCVLARMLSDRGAVVCVVGRNLASLERMRAALPAGRQVHGYACDFDVEGQVEGLAARVLHEHAGLDILVHSAAAMALGRVDSLPATEFDRLYRVNVRAPYVLTQALLPALVRRHGQVVFVNSSVAARVKEQVGAYAATKHALRALADTLRIEVNAQGVRVLSVYPGKTATEMQFAIQEQTGITIDRESLLTPGDVASVIVKSLEMPRTAEITDIHIRPMKKSD